MVALWIVGILLVLILLILLLRAGVRIRWGEELTVSAVVGPIKLQLVPKPKKEKAKKTKKKPAKKPQSKEEKPKKKQKKKSIELTFADIRSAVPALFESLKRGLRKTGRRMRIDPMKLCVAFGGDDPANVAETYGWVSSAMWAIMPELEELMRIPDPQIHLEVDFDAGKTRSEGEFGVWFRIHDFLAIGLAFGIPLLKWFMAFKKSKKKNPKQGDTSPKKAETKQRKKKNDYCI